MACEKTPQAALQRATALRVLNTTRYAQWRAAVTPCLHYATRNEVAREQLHFGGWILCYTTTGQVARTERRGVT